MRGAVGVDGGADDPHLVRCRHHFEAAALKRAHLDHLVEEPVQQSDVDEFRVRAGDEKWSRPFHVDAGGSGRSQSAVTQHHKVLAARVARTGVFKDFIRLKIHETHAHGAASEDSFQMATAAAAAENFLGVEGDDGVPTLPDPFAGREAAEAYAVAAGANQIENVEWSVKDSAQLEARAYAAALKRAKGIAEQTASQTGLKLGEIVSIVNATSSNNRFSRGNAGGLALFAMVEAPKMAMLKLQLGMVEHEASVTITFSIAR